jgi:hypothetical protein
MSYRSWNLQEVAERIGSVADDCDAEVMVDYLVSRGYLADALDEIDWIAGLDFLTSRAGRQAKVDKAISDLVETTDGPCTWYIWPDDVESGYGLCAEVPMSNGHRLWVEIAQGTSLDSTYSWGVSEMDDDAQEEPVWSEGDYGLDLDWCINQAVESVIARVAEVG